MWKRGKNITSPKLSSSFLSDVLKLIGGATLAQVVAILASPIITRLYSPDTFGQYAVISSIICILGVIVCLRYEFAIMLPKADKEAANILSLSLISAAFVSALIIPIILLFKQPILNILNIESLGPYLWIIPPYLLSIGIFSSLNWWNSRFRHFASLSIAGMANLILVTIIQLGAGLTGHNHAGSLIAAGFFGSLIATLFLGIQTLQKYGLMLKDSINSLDMVYLSRRYKRFPLFDTWAALLNIISLQFPIFLLSALFSASDVGYYALAMVVLQLPINLIGSATSQVFFQRAANAKFDGKLSNIVEDIFFRLAVIGTFPFLLLALTGKEIFIVAFGAQWSEAGVYAQILAIWIYFVFLISPISTVFTVLEKQRLFLLFTIILFGTRALALIVGGTSGDIRIALMLFSAVGAIDYAGMGLWIFDKVGATKSKILKNSIGLIGYCIFAFGLIAIAKWMLFLSSPTIIILDTILLILYYTLFLNKVK